MAESVLSRQLARLRVAYAASPIKRFLTWWGSELLALLPARVRATFADRRDEVLLRLDADALSLQRRGREPVSFARSGDVDEIRPQIERLTMDGEEPPRVVFALPTSRVLQRALTLPAAAEENLRQVLGFEMDRQTPFRADQVYFDQRIVQRDVAARQIRVEMALVPRAAIDPDFVALNQVGAALDAADAVDENGARAGFNLLPVERRARRPNVWLRINAGLAVAVLVLLFVVMGQSVGNRAQALEKLREHTENVHAEAKSVAALRNTLGDAVEGANFLTQKRNARPALSDIMLDVTHRLNNDTWLQRLSVNGDQVQLQGQSKEAAGLITVLQQSPYLDGPALQGAITPDARTGKEQFLIQAKVRLPEPVAAEPARTRNAAPVGSDAPAGESPPLTPVPPAPAPTPATTPVTTDPAVTNDSDDTGGGQRDATDAQR
jgi:general secretion pathway protein L